MSVGAYVKPHLTVDRPLAFSFQLVFCFCSYWWNGLLSRASLLELVYFVLFFLERNTSITVSQRSRASSPSMRNPALEEMISDSPELWDIDVCFLHMQLRATNGRLPKKHNSPPEFDFESSRSPDVWVSKKKKPSLQCWAVLTTWQYCR